MTSRIALLPPPPHFHLGGFRDLDAGDILCHAMKDPAHSIKHIHPSNLSK